MKLKRGHVVPICWYENKSNSIDTTQVYIRVVIDDLQKSHSRTATGNRRKESAFTPFNRKTATWQQEKKRKL